MTNPKSDAEPKGYSDWIREGKERGYHDYWKEMTTIALTKSLRKEIEKYVAEFKETNIYKTARVSGYGRKMEDYLTTTLTSFREKVVAEERERIKEELLVVLNDYEEPEFEFETVKALQKHLIKVGEAVKALTY